MSFEDFLKWLDQQEPFKIPMRTPGHFIGIMIPVAFQNVITRDVLFMSFMTKESIRSITNTNCRDASLWRAVGDYQRVGLYVVSVSVDEKTSAVCFGVEPKPREFFTELNSAKP